VAENREAGASHWAFPSGAWEREKTQHPWLRTRAEAAILEARGDVAGAARKLAELEATILRLPANARRDVSLRLLERWKAELCSVSEA